MDLVIICPTTFSLAAGATCCRSEMPSVTCQRNYISINVQVIGSRGRPVCGPISSHWSRKRVDFLSQSLCSRCCLTSLRRKYSGWESFSLAICGPTLTFGRATESIYARNSCRLTSSAMVAGMWSTPSILLRDVKFLFRKKASLSPF